MDAALVRLLNIGIYLAYKNLLTEALNETLEKRLPYLMLSAEDFSKNYGEQKFEIVKTCSSKLTITHIFHFFKTIVSSKSLSMK